MRRATQCSFHKGADAQAVSAWVAQRIPGCGRGFGPCTALSATRGGDIIGAMVFHNYNPESGVIEMSGAAMSPDWLNRSILRAMHEYVFDTAKCQMVVMRVSETNDRVRRICKAFGYDSYKIPRLRGRDEAEIIATLTDDQWRVSKFNR